MDVLHSYTTIIWNDDKLYGLSIQTFLHVPVGQFEAYQVSWSAAD